MRLGVWWRTAVFASLALLASGQLCMMTTCAPRLGRVGNHAAHACCDTGARAPAPAPPGHQGTMPCSVAMSLAHVPGLDTPQPALPVLGVQVLGEDVVAPSAPATTGDLDRDHGPPPGHTGSAPAGLRAPPLA